MYKIFLTMLVLSVLAFSCRPPVETGPEAPSTPLKEKPAVTVTPAVTPGQIIKPSPSPTTTPIPAATPGQAIKPSPTPTSTPKGDVKVSLREQAQGKAKTFIEGDSTFRYDGIKETLKLAGERAIEEGKAWELIYTFESRYSGYGDRSGKVLLPVITPHKVRIVVAGENITEAVMDGQWDMLMQRMLR